MEYHAGTDVSSLLVRRGPFSVADACEIACQTALALGCIQQHDLVHRDVKLAIQFCSPIADCWRDWTFLEPNWVRSVSWRSRSVRMDFRRSLGMAAQRNPQTGRYRLKAGSNLPCLGACWIRSIEEDLDCSPGTTLRPSRTLD